MAPYVIISNDKAVEVLELLKKVLKSPEIQQQLSDANEFVDLTPVIELAFPSPEDIGVDTPETEIDELDDEDLRQIVQIRVDNVMTTDAVAYESWADTDIEPESLDDYRAEFPEHDYRLVAVYDEIVAEFDSVDQQEITAEDEIGLLKAEVLSLKAQLAQEQDHSPRQTRSSK